MLSLIVKNVSGARTFAPERIAMSDNKAPSPSLADLATRINTEFAAIRKDDQDLNKSVVQRAIIFGRTLSQVKDQVGHGKWEKWLKDNCRKISARTAQRYMKLADSPEVRAELGKNDTVSVLSLRAALAMANKTTGAKRPSDQYDSAENNLVKKLEALSPDTAEAAANDTVERLNATVARIKGKMKADAPTKELASVQ
jgi:hypothetical protein